MYKEGDIYTWDEWINLCRAFVQSDPGNNGNGRTIGMGTPSYYFPDAFGVYQTSSEYGFGAFSPDNGKYVWTAARPETLEGLTIAKSLWDEGLLWKDVILGGSPDDQYTAGMMGMLFQNFTPTRVYNIQKAMLDSKTTANVQEACALAKVIGPDNTYWIKQSQCYYGTVVMSSNISPEAKDKWLSILDWLLSPEGQLFMRYGIPDVDYKFEYDGTSWGVKCLWPESKTFEGVQEDPYVSGSRYFYECYAGGISQQIAPISSMPKDIVESTNEHFEYLANNGFIRRFDYSSSYFSGEMKDTYGDFSTETNEKMIDLITNASANQLPELWNAWIDSMMPKVQKVLDELNSNIKNMPEEHEVKYVN